MDLMDIVRDARTWLTARVSSTCAWLGKLVARAKQFWVRLRG